MPLSKPLAAMGLSVTDQAVLGPQSFCTDSLSRSWDASRQVSAKDFKLHKGVLLGAGVQSLSTTLGTSCTLTGPHGERPPPGWPGFITKAENLRREEPLRRGGLFDDEKLIMGLVDRNCSMTSKPARNQDTDLNITAQGSVPKVADFSMSSCPHKLYEPLLACVDRASLPEHIDPDECEDRIQHLARESEVRRMSSCNMPFIDPASNSLLSCQTTDAIELETWDADLQAWCSRYGCPDAACSAI